MRDMAAMEQIKGSRLQQDLATKKLANFDQDRIREAKNRAMEQAVQMRAGGADDATVLGFLNEVGQEYGLPEADPAVLPRIDALASASQEKVGPQGGTVKLANGNLGYLNDAGQIIDTGQPFFSAPRTVKGPSGEVFNVDLVRGEVTPVVSREDAVTGAEEAAEAKARGTASGKAEGEKVAEAPGVISSADETIALVESLLDHPGFSYIVGKSSVLPVVPGTEAADASALLDQIKGKQFMEAYQGLKGGGQITEVEGVKAEQAISRMRRAQSEEGFADAAEDFLSIVRKAKRRAQKALNQMPEQEESIDDLVNRYADPE